MDYIFKSSAMAPQEERSACLVNAASEGAKVVEALAAVLFVQFEDGATWGDPTADNNAGRELLAARPEKLAFMANLVESYDKGEADFRIALANGVKNPAVKSVAYCLVGDAKDRKISTIELAKERLANAEHWHERGIF